MIGPLNIAKKKLISFHYKRQEKQYLSSIYISVKYIKKKKRIYFIYTQKLNSNNSVIRKITSLGFNYSCETITAKKYSLIRD